MPSSTISLISDIQNGFGTIVFSIKDKADTKATNSLVRSHLSRFHTVAPDDDTAFYINSMEQLLESFDSLFDGLNKFLWFLGLATLFSGVIGVANMMYTSAKERTREIGIRKAIGARPSEIKNMFLCESIILTTIAGYVGVFFGWLVLLAIGALMPDEVEILQKPSIDLPIALSATLVLIVSGTLSGLRPAIYASQLNPIEALKEEN